MVVKEVKYVKNLSEGVSHSLATPLKDVKCVRQGVMVFMGVIIYLSLNFIFIFSILIKLVKFKKRIVCIENRQLILVTIFIRFML